MKVVLQDLTKIFESRHEKGKEVIAVNKFNYEIPDGKLIKLLSFQQLTSNYDKLLTKIKAINKLLTQKL